MHGFYRSSILFKKRKKGRQSVADCRAGYIMTGLGVGGLHSDDIAYGLILDSDGNIYMADS